MTVFESAVDATFAGFGIGAVYTPAGAVERQAAAENVHAPNEGADHGPPNFGGACIC